MVVIPCSVADTPVITKLPVITPIAIPKFDKPLTKSVTLVMSAPSVTILLIELAISPIPCTAFNAPPVFVLPSIINASPTRPANSLIRPDTLEKFAPSSAISSTYCLSLSRSLRKPVKPTAENAKLTLGTVKFLILSIALSRAVATFQAPILVPIRPTVVRISPNLVSINSAQVSISSVIPSHSFISSTILLTRLSDASPMKS